MNKVFNVFITLMLGSLLFFVGMDAREEGEPNLAYQVYLNGNKIGLIKSKHYLYQLIDDEQAELKKEYNVDKIFPPTGLDVEKIYTYSNDIVDEANIYNQIKEVAPFTVEGYTATITYTTEDVIGEDEEYDDIESVIREPLKINMMDSKYIKEALYNTATAFIGTTDLDNYEKDTQEEINETGEIITSVYFQEIITIKKSLISTKDFIFKDSNTLSRYLLFGTLKNESTYEAKTGDDLVSIAASNNLNIEELLIANPKYPSANSLISEGEKINVQLINPLVNIVYRKTVVEDVPVQFKTITVEDNTKYTSYKEVTTQGENGSTRITQNIKYINGEIKDYKIDKRQVLKAAVDQVLTVGTKTSWGSKPYRYDTGNDEWSWPTAIPYKITSGFEWRWGEFHKGIDIAGPGKGSPIMAVKEGTVYKINTNASKKEGLSVYIDHHNGYITQYMHMSKIIAKVGQEVNKGDLLGLMGNTGNSYGPHLHLGVWINGQPYIGGTVVDPCKTIFKC